MCTLLLLFVLPFSVTIVGSISEESQPVKCVILQDPNASSCSTALMNWGEQETLLKLFTLDSELKFQALVQFILLVFHRNDICSEVIGVVGDLDSWTASIIHTLASRSNLSITLVASSTPSTFPPVTNLGLPNILDMNPIQNYIEAVVSLSGYLNWTRIGMISDESSYHQFVSEKLQEILQLVPGTTVTPCLRVTETEGFFHTLQRVEEYDTRIIVLSMNADLAVTLLEEAESFGLKWPDYAWILLDFGSHEFFGIANYGVFVLNEVNIPKPVASLNRNCPILHNSLLAVSVAQTTNIFNTSFHGVSGLVKFRNGRKLTNLSIAQYIHNYPIGVAIYDPDSKELSVLYDLKAGDVPRGFTLVLDERHTPLEISLVMTFFASIFILLTTLLTLYVYFRKEPEIKATSVLISLCAYVGCYLSLLYTPIIVMESHSVASEGNQEDILCQVSIWLSGVALPTSLILATIFVKMLRVYAIFNNPFKTSRRKIFLSDRFLFLYILLIVSPNFLALTLLSSLDPLQNSVIRNVHKSHVELVNQCTNQNTEYWVVAFFLYIIVLSLAVMVLALKSNKIRYKCFRDTKETNMFVFVTEFTLFLSIVCWIFYRQLNKVSVSNLRASVVAACSSSIIIPLACQFLLFIPKVYPPLKRQLSRKRCSLSDRV